MISDLLAQKINIGGQEINGPIRIAGVQGNNIKLATIINRVITFLTPLAGVVLLLVLIMGGYGYLTSQGDPNKVKKAQATITAGVIGFILLVFSYLAVKIISYVFNLHTGIF